MLLIRISDTLIDMLDLKHVNTFLTVCDNGSFSRAAEKLDLAQPTVSLHIKSLESQLGYLLFERIGKRVVISPDGRKFLPSAEEMIRLASEALQPAAKNQPVVGELNICIVQSICAYKLPAFLSRFHQRFPGVRSKISVHRPSTYMLEQLQTGEFDCSIVLEAPFDIPSLESRMLWSTSLKVVASPSHPLTKSPPLQVTKSLPHKM